MNVNKININQSEPTYYIASDIYDVSAHNNGATFESLSTLLGSDNLNTLIPTAVRCGGMSIRFVQSSDNKYVKFFCIADEFTTDVTKWQGVDEDAVNESQNLITSGAAIYASFSTAKAQHTLAATDAATRPIAPPRSRMRYLPKYTTPIITLYRAYHKANDTPSPVKP